MIQSKTKTKDRDLSDNPLAFAAIHATILSIIIAFTSAYIIYKYQITQQIEMQAIQEAERINKLYFPGISYLPTAKDFVLPSNIEEVRLAISRANLLATKNILQSAIDAFKLPSDPKERAKEMAGLINIIGHRYPFPVAINKTENGWVQGVQQPVRFDDIKSVQKWSDDMQHIQTQLSSFHATVKLLGYPSEWTISPDVTFEKLGYISDPSLILKTFLEYTMETMTIAYNTNHLLTKAKMVKEFHLPTWKIIVILLITGMVFLCSVGLPILIENTPKVYYTYVPMTYYFVAFLAVIQEILSN